MSIKRVGIAGYMGAGKSSCVQFLDTDHTVIINADDEAKLLMQNDKKILDALIEHFGDTIRSENGIDSKSLGKIVFNSFSELLYLNSVVHPPLIKYLKKLLFEKKYESTIERIILDAAIIPVWNIDSWFDLHIWVDTPREIRFCRLIEKYKGNISGEDLRNRMDFQEKLFSPPDEKVWSYVGNAGTIDNTIGQMNRALKKSI